MNVYDYDALQLLVGSICYFHSFSYVFINELNINISTSRWHVYIRSFMNIGDYLSAYIT